MNFQGVVMNVAELNRSIDFYREVLGFTLLSQEEELAVASAAGNERAQILVLRSIGSSPLGGARHVGLRAFVLEAESSDQLERISGALDSRKLLINRREHSEWTAIVGRDPDGVAVVVTWHPEDGSSAEGWKTLDDFLYGIGE